MTTTDGWPERDRGERVWRSAADDSPESLDAMW